MKYNKTIFFKVALGAALCLGMSSCEEYLDKEPESTVSADEAFKNFNNFQGFVEEIYRCIPDKEKCKWCPTWNWGEDEIMNPEAEWRMTHQIDIGNFRAWYLGVSGQDWGNWLMTPSTNSTSNNSFDHSLWGHMWYCIRKANMGLANIENIASATQEEKDMLAGQLYFFRAWWHFEALQWWGPLPYIDRELDSSGDDLRLNRFSVPGDFYASLRDNLDKCIADFQKAADLLPIDWDKTITGNATQSKNMLRINKIMALGYMGRCQLYAASPLVVHGAQMGALANGKTYQYDAAKAKAAAETLGKVIALVEGGKTQYQLASFDFTNVYDHEAPSAGNSYCDIFYTKKQNWKQPGANEAIFRGPSGENGNANNSNWNTTKVFGPKVEGMVDHDNVIHQPTAELIEKYGMANGLPLEDPESGFDPNYPFRNRDPRFYHDVVFDGFKYVNATMSAAEENLRYLALYTGGKMRPVANGSRTGYFMQKLTPHTCNKWDKAYDFGDQLHTYLSYMRLADIYLMYAEAGAAAGGASYKASSCALTAEAAINTIRRRCGAGDVAAKYVADQKKFMDEVRRERAVELAFEGFRFTDLQRWLLLTEPGYTTKSSHEFTRGEKDSFFTEKDPSTGLNVNDPADAKVNNFRKVTIITREFSAKHYWFPLPQDQTYIYSDFSQNPGW